MSDLELIADPLDAAAFYDRFGNRWVFRSHDEYETVRRQHLIEWLACGAPLCFL